MKLKKIYAYSVAIIIASIIVGSANLSAEWGWKQATNMPSNLLSEYFLDVFFLPANPQYGWACGYNSNVLRTTDGGKSWSSSRTTGKYQLESIMFVNEKVGYCSGPDMSGFGGNTVGGVFKSTDGGATWFNVTPRPSDPQIEVEIWGQYFWDEKNGVALGGGCGDGDNSFGSSYQKFWRTTDGGASWGLNRHDVPGSKLSDAIIDPVTQIGYAAGSSSMWKTTDAGFTWKYYANTGSIFFGGYDWQEEMTWKGSSFLLPYSQGCDGTTGADGGLRFSVDGGKTWRDTEMNKSFFGSFLIDTLRGWGAGFDKSVYYTSDGGQTWNEYNCGIPEGVDLDDIWFINDTTGWVVGKGVYEFKIYTPSKPVIVADKPGEQCYADTITLSTTEKYNYYKWSTGETTPTIRVTKPGKYSVYVITDYICDSATSKPYTIAYYPTSKMDIQLSSMDDPCEGDTVQLIVSQKFSNYLWNTGDTTKSITITKEGNYTVSSIDSNGCTVEASRYVIFHPNPIPQIDSTRKLTFCIGDSVTLTAPGGYAAYMWYAKPDTVVISTNRSITVTQSGTYNVVVQSIYDCVNRSDNFIVKVLDDTNRVKIMVDTVPYPIDSTSYPLLTCADINIKNYSQKPFSLSEAFLKLNVPFSIPLSQFPIELQPGDEKTVRVCFSPDSIGLARDTLVIIDICGEHELPIYSYGVESSFTQSTKCDLKIEFVPTGIKGNFSYSFSNPYPNPTSGDVNVAFTGDVPDNTDDENVTASIYNIYGEKVQNGIISSHGDSNQNGILNVEGTIEFKSKELPQGVYYVIINAGGKSVSMDFIKE